MRCGLVNTALQLCNAASKLTASNSVGSAVEQPHVSCSSRRTFSEPVASAEALVTGSTSDQHRQVVSAPGFTQAAAVVVCACTLLSQEGAGGDQMPVWKRLLCDCMVSGAHDRGPQHEILQILLYQERDLQQQAAEVHGLADAAGAAIG